MGSNLKAQPCDFSGLTITPYRLAYFDSFTTRVVKLHGFAQCQTDHTMSVEYSKEGVMTIFIVYVYDIIIIGDDHDMIGELKQLLAKEFEVKDLGQLKCFLGGGSGTIQTWSLHIIKEVYITLFFKKREC